MSNYPDGMTAHDWQHINGECDEGQHNVNRYGQCRDCGEWFENEGPDPDDANDRAREEREDQEQQR